MSKIAIIFPGQGSQFPLMGEDFYKQSEVYKSITDKLFEVNPKLKEIWSDENGTDINLTKNAQLLLFANQIGILEEVKSKFDVENEVYAGFSLGEYSALCAAGFFDFNLGLDIVTKRADLMGSVTSDYKTKVVIGKTKSELEEIINKAQDDLNTNIIISNYNLEKQLLINFPQSDEDTVVNFLTEAGVRRLVDIKVSGPFHTKIYEEASEEFYKFLEGIRLSEDRRPIYLNYTAHKYTGEDNIKHLMKEQMINGVLWYDEIQNMIKDGVDTFVEIGSKSILAAMIKKIDRKANVITVEKLEDINKLEEIWSQK